MFKICATINTVHNEFDGMLYEGNDLNTIWEQIKIDYPSVTSVVLVFTNPE